MIGNSLKYIIPYFDTVVPKYFLIRNKIGDPYTLLDTILQDQRLIKHQIQCHIPNVLQSDTILLNNTVIR